MVKVYVFFIKGYEMHSRLTGYWLEKLVYLAGYKWNGSHLDCSSNLLTSFLASALPSYRLFNTGAELILLKHESLFCISLRINEGSYNGLQHLYWLGTWKENGGKIKLVIEGSLVKGLFAKWGWGLKKIRWCTAQRPQ